MPRALQVSDGMEYRGPLKRICIAELIQPELELPADSGIVWNLEESMQLRIDIFYIFQARERNRLQLMCPPHVQPVPQQHCI